QIAATGTVGNATAQHALLLNPSLLDRIAYAWANQPTAASYTPAPDYAYNATGGTIGIRRQQAGIYEVELGNLPGWGTNLSSAVGVSASGSSTPPCSVLIYSPSPNRPAVTVGCLNAPPRLPADSAFTVLVVGNQSLPTGSAFV